jgi:hypothetical protein
MFTIYQSFVGPEAAQDRLNEKAVKNMPSPPSPDDVFAELVARLAEALQAADRDTYRKALCTHGLRFSVRVQPVPQSQIADLPAELANTPPAVRRVYALIRDVRADPGDSAEPLWPAHILARLNADDPDAIARSTVEHALKKLRDLELVFVDRAQGYRLGRQQARLPFVEGRSESSSQREDVV